MEPKKGKKLQILIMFILGIIFYVLLGKEWISLQDDSVYYLQPQGEEGVMPLYPLFIFGIKCIFGQSIYLNAVVIIQSLLAVICTMVFVLYLQKQFKLRNWESFLLYIACMFPFSIYLPEAGITHQILTEGLSYALFYLYFWLVLKYVFTKKKTWLAGTVGMSFVMGLLRGQLLLLLITTLLVFIFVQCLENRGKKLLYKLLGMICVAFGGGVVVLLSVLAIYQIKGYYIQEQLPIIQNRKAEVTSEEAPKETVTDKQSKPDTMSQFETLLLTKGFYEADEEDAELFQTPEMQELFRYVYQAVDEKQYRYAYARQDLYMWKDLVRDEIGSAVAEGTQKFLYENPNTEMNIKKAQKELAFQVLIHHFDRYLYHTIRIMIPGFISSVFFQIEPIYLVCHFVTLFLYLFSLSGSIYGWRKGGDKKVFLLMLLVLSFMIVMVVVANLLFLGLQRYMVYAMGIFYSALYLLVKELYLLTCNRYSDKKWLLFLKKKIYT